MDPIMKGRMLMKRTVVRYKAKPEMVQENQRLIEKVFQEMNAKAPEGVRYMALKLADGTFIHFSSAEGGDTAGPLHQIEAFKAFQSDVRQRCAEPPQSMEATLIGHYRMLNE
jgi:hypothetical protein